MKVVATGAHAHQLTRLGFMNCYLVRESDSYTLIDTTIGGAAQGILHAARATGSEPIARIALTHARSLPAWAKSTSRSPGATPP